MSPFSRLASWLRSFTGRRPSRTFTKRPGRRASYRLQLESLEDRWLLSTALHLDLGTGSEAAAPGYTGVPLTAYAPATGYGWASLSGLTAIDRGTADPLTRSFHQGAGGCFLVDLPTGTYDVTPTIGDPLLRRDYMAISLEGQSVASGLSTGPGRFLQPTYRVQVTDGQLNFGISCTGGKGGTVALDALDIQVVAAVSSPLLVDAGANLTIGEGTPVSFSGQASGGTAPLSYSWDFGDSSTVGGNLTPQHTYSDNGSYPATLTVTDAAGTTVQNTATITVTNVSPTVTLTGAPASSHSPEGTALTLGATITDPSTADTAAGFTRAWSVTKNGAAFASGTANSFSFTPNDNGSYVVTLTATDKDGGPSTASATITVDNVVPTAGFSNGGAVNEGSTGTVSFSGQADSSSADTSAGFTYSYDFDNSGTFEVTNSTSAAATVPASFLADGPGSLTVKGRIQDKDGGFTDYTTTITISNVPPTVTLTGLPASSHSPEGSALTLGATLTDPSAVDMATGFQLSWSVTKNGAAFATGTASSFSFTPNDNGSYVVSLGARDKNGDTGAATATILVDNVAPTASLSNSGPVYQGTTATVTFSGQADPSSADSSAGFTYSFDFDNSGTFEVTNSATATATVPASFLTGVSSRTVKGRIQDKDGAFTDYTTTISLLAVIPTVTLSGLPTSSHSPEGTALTLGATITDLLGSLNFTRAWSVTKNGAAFATGTASGFSFTPDDNGSYVVTLAATNFTGGTGTASATITVDNLAPAAGFSNSGAVDEGSTGRVYFIAPADPSSIDTTAGFTYSFDFDNSGTFEVTNSTSAAATVPASFLADGPASRTVKGRIQDKDGGFIDYTTTIPILNVAPTVTLTGLPASGHSPEGSALTLGATITDPAAADTTAGFSRAWSVTKNGAAFAAGTASSFAFTPNDNGSYVVTLTATDKNGGTGNTTATITVDNVAPTAVFANSGAVNEGSTGTVAFSVPTDVASADTSAGFTYSFDFDNNGTFDVTNSPSATATVPASFLADGPGSRTVKGRIQDKDGGRTDYTTTITINNVPPTVGLPASYSASPGSAIAFSATVSDPSPVDAAGPFTYSWNFGDGTTSTSAVPTHAYSNAGGFSVSVTVKDKDGSATTKTTNVVISVAGINTSPYIVTPYDKIPNFGASPTITSVQSGSWLATSTWSTGVLPAAGDVVSINPSTTVTFDASSTPALDTVVIQAAGHLVFRTDISTQLSVINLLVLSGGELQVGTPTNPVAAGVKADIVFPNVPLDTVKDPSQYGHGLIGLGKVTMAGATKASTFVRLAADAHAGDTTLTLSQPVTDWVAGDKLVLPDSRQLVGTERFAAYIPQWELPVIQSVSANGLVVTLTSPLQFDHLGVRNPSGAVDYQPHVGDLTRNVVVHSQSATGTRGYVLFTQRADVDIRYTQFAGLGRTTNSAFDDTTYDSSGNVTHLGTNQSSRYPVYFRHLMGPTTTPANGYQYTFSGNTVMCPLNPMPFRWGLTLNDSHYGLVSDNVVYNWAGAGIVGESGNESYNVIQHNFVVAVRGDQNPRNNTGQDGAAYWFNNFNNYIHDNVAADAVCSFVGIVAGSGFNLYVPAATTNVKVPLFPGADLTVAGQFKTVNIQMTPVLEFARNEAYGAMATGLTLWHLGTDGYSVSNIATSIIKDFVAWNCWEDGFFAYPIQNVTFDGFIVRGSSRALNSADGGRGWAAGDYWAGNVTLQRADIQGVWEGVGYATNTPGTFTIKDSYFRNYSADVAVTTLETPGARTSKPARTTIINNVRFDPYPGASKFTAISMNFTMAAGADYIQKDEVYVYSYNGVSGDNFQVYYLEQAPTFIVPQTTYYGPDNNGDGIGDWVDSQGAPVAGLTNAQAWSQYGVAIAGSVSPTSTTRANVRGYVRAF